MARKKDRELLRGHSPQEALAGTLLPHQAGDVLELDEVWTFVGSKKNRIWIWIVLCRRTRQVVAWMWGDHSITPCQQLTSNSKARFHLSIKVAFALPMTGLLMLKSFQSISCISRKSKARPTNTQRVPERFNLTLRQRLPRLIRKALSFSKSLKMHLICLRRFFMRYNLDQAQNTSNLSLSSHYQKCLEHFRRVQHHSRQ